MRGVNDKNFLNAWHILQTATCPDAGRMAWAVGDVQWSRERHNFSGASYSVAMEVHLLSRAGRGPNAWRLMVVVEYWWDGGHAMVRTSTWARVLSGSAKSVLSWLRDHDQGRDRAVAPASRAS